MLYVPPTGKRVGTWSSKRARGLTPIPADPLFRLIDGAVCPSAGVSTPDAMRNAYHLVIERALIRIAMPILPGQQHFTVSVVSDPNKCNLDLSAGILSFYRKPLP